MAAEMTADLQIKIANTPAVLDLNFDALKSALVKQIEAHRVVVTRETVAGAKKLATELNQTANHIDVRRKDEMTKAGAQITAFGFKMKELFVLCKEGRQEILDQVKVFEDETRDNVRDLLVRFRLDQWNKFEVSEEFRKADIDDLFLISNLTGTGALTDKAKTAVELRVVKDLNMQTRVNRRLTELISVGLDAGLDYPIHRNQMENHLFTKDDDEWDRQLKKVVDMEIERRDETEKNRLRKSEREEKAKADLKKEMESKMQKLADDQDKPAAEPRNPNHHIMRIITATFSIHAPAGLSDESISRSVKSKLAQAGFRSVISVSVD